MPTNNPFSVSEQNNAARVYLEETVKNYQNEADIWSMASDWTDTPINNLGTQVPLELSPNPSLSVVDLNGGATPTIGARNLDKMTINYGQLMQGRGFTYEALLNNNKETAEDEVMASIESDVKQFMAFLNAYVSRGDGTAGLATISSNYGTPDNNSARCNGTYDSIGVSQLVVNGYYKFYDATGATQRTGTVGSGAIQMTSKDASDANFGSDIPSDVVATDIIVPEIGTTNAATGFIAGLPYIIDSAGTYFGKARATFTGLQAYENALSGALTAGSLMSTYEGITQRGGYFKEKLEDSLWILLNVSMHQTYYNLALSSGAAIGGLRTIQDTGNNPGLDLGYKNFEFTWFNAPMKKCNMLRGDEIYFCNPKYFKKAVLKDVGGLAKGIQPEGGVMLVNSDGVPILTKANYHDFVGQFFSPTPHKLGKISAIQYSGVITQKAAQV
ncbi:MAG: hypothetical protein E6Q97_17590 [Desulfurellales bacterium]|nr:MAG: hypothetical protein E6Q97_17590 [Desulfurellales bacterium]